MLFLLGGSRSAFLCFEREGRNGGGACVDDNPKNDPLTVLRTQRGPLVTTRFVAELDHVGANEPNLLGQLDVRRTLVRCGAVARLLAVGSVPVRIPEHRARSQRDRALLEHDIFIARAVVAAISP